MDATFRMVLSPTGFADVHAIAEDVWPKTFAAILSPEQIVYMMKMMYDQSVLEKELAAGIYWEVLVVDGKPVGYLSYGSHSLPDTVKLHKVYLLQEYQHQGLGSMMLRHALLAAREMGAKFLRLNVNKYNEQAKRAYERNGFQIIESVKNDIGHGFFMDDYVMQRAV